MSRLFTLILVAWLVAVAWSIVMVITDPAVHGSVAR